MNAKRTFSCPSCGNDSLSLLGGLPDARWFAGRQLARTLRGGDLYRCSHCTLKFRYPVLETAFYDEMYDNAGTSTWHMETSRPDWDLISAYINGHKPLGGSVLDFGCYCGGMLARLDQKYQLHGVEINRAAAAIASERTRAMVWPSLQDVPESSLFDVIIATDVVEHVQNPASLIDRLGGLLSEDGVLILTTGDANNDLWSRFGANWWYCFHPEHIAFISRTWIDRMADDLGLSVLQCDTFRYRRLGTIRLLFEIVLTYWYGLLPNLYLQMGNLLKKALGRPEMTSVPGNGVSADHILIVLARKLKS